MVASQQITNQLASRRGQGQALPGSVNQEISSKIGADFSIVRVHTDSSAVQMSRGLGARAFTHGNDIYFNSGQYDPGSKAGKHLLAHELTHTVQQGQGINRMIQRTSCAFGEIEQWAIRSYTDTRPPAGLGDAVASVNAVCGRGQDCNCVNLPEGADEIRTAAWNNIQAARGTDQSDGADYMCVGTTQCDIVNKCTECNGTGGTRKVDRSSPLAQHASYTFNGHTLYFYEDSLRGWCNRDDYRNGCAVDND